MTDKRFLFRGFHPDENGKTTITLPKVSEQEIAEVERKLKTALDEFNLTYAAKLNDKLHSLKAERNVKIKGEWIYGGIFHRKADEVQDGSISIITASLEHVGNANLVIPETVGQWVTTDKNGKDVFVGDTVRSSLADDIPIGAIVYDEENHKYIVSICDGYETTDIDEYEPIVCGNKWEDDE